MLPSLPPPNSYKPWNFITVITSRGKELEPFRKKKK